MIKKIFYILIFIFLLFSYSYAHPGRTDANGGHYNRATGEYHYHTGEYAGQGSSGSSSSDKSYFYKDVFPSKITNPYKSSSPPSTPPDDYSAVVFTWCFFGVLFYIFLLKPVIKVVRKNSASKNKKSCLKISRHRER